MNKKVNVGNRKYMKSDKTLKARNSLHFLLVKVSFERKIEYSSGEEVFVIKQSLEFFLQTKSLIML